VEREKEGERWTWGKQENREVYLRSVAHQHFDEGKKKKDQGERAKEKSLETKSFLIREWKREQIRWKGRALQCRSSRVTVGRGRREGGMPDGFNEREEPAREFPSIDRRKKGVKM